MQVHHLVSLGGWNDTISISLTLRYQKWKLDISWTRTFENSLKDYEVHMSRGPFTGAGLGPEDCTTRAVIHHPLLLLPTAIAQSFQAPHGILFGRIII